jgi:hypothetical protein
MAPPPPSSPPLDRLLFHAVTNMHEIFTKPKRFDIAGWA